MDKLKMHSLNKVDENIGKIGRLFPNCLTERKGENGEIEHAIDFDMLRQELSSVVVEGNEERYQFTWPDKKKSVLLANAPIAKTLRPCREESVDFDNTENLYIEGDNLDVLKLLQETYLGKVKMIYIDPPYNTGNDFVYEDDFAQSVDEYMENSGQYDDEGNRLVKNLDSNGRFHTDWLNMIYPRLKLAKDLLTNDGVICLSIGDRELANSVKILDDIFGSQNQVCIFTWKARAKPTNAGNAKYRPQKVSDYILVYGKMNPDELLHNVLPAKERVYPHEDKDGKYRLTTILTSNRGTFRRETMRFSSGGYQPDEDYRWKAGKATIDALFESNHMELNDDGVPMEKKYEHEESDPLYPIYSFIDPDLSGTAEHGKTELGNLVGKQHGFDTVKPVLLLKYLVNTFSKEDSIIVDFFSGSATTAQAVMELNSENDEKRKFVLVQIPEAIGVDSEAFKAGYKNICEIGKERIRRAGAKIQAENDKLKDVPLIETEEDATLVAAAAHAKGKQGIEQIKPLFEQVDISNNLDTGFRVLKLDSTNMKDVYYNPADYEADLFDTLTDNIKDDRTPEDLLFQVMLDLGVLLSSKIEESTIAGKKVFDVADGFLIACFDDNITEETIKAIAQKKPYYFVMRDSSMANDSVATNFEQIFATYSPETVRKVL